MKFVYEYGDDYRGRKLAFSEDDFYHLRKFYLSSRKAGFSKAQSREIAFKVLRKLNAS